MICALIMAGGKGSRFWPLSTEEKPKQFLNLFGDKTMIQDTVDRVKKLVPLEKIFIVTGSSYRLFLERQLPEISSENIIVEPEGKNTAPCIILASLRIREKYKDATMIVMPSDHFVGDEDGFVRCIETAAKFIEENKKAVATLGIKPSRAETGYGYIKLGDRDGYLSKGESVKVERFVEKPDKSKAEEYFNSGNYLWNSGIYVWDLENIISLMKRNMNEMFKKISDGCKSQDEGKLTELYKGLSPISVDYALIEKLRELYVIPSEFQWDDVGNLEALNRCKKLK